GRQPYFKALIARHGTTEWTLRRIALAAAITGWYVTTSIPVFAPFLSITDISVLMMITVAWVSVAVSMLAVQPSVYTGYLVACMITIFIGFARYGTGHDLLVLGVAMCLGGPIMVRLGVPPDHHARGASVEGAA